MLVMSFEKSESVLISLLSLTADARSLVSLLASGVAIARPASNASRGVVGQFGAAGGAIYEEHLALAGRVRALRGGLTRLEKPEIFNSQTHKQTLITDPV